MAINVDLADSAAINPNRNNNFGLRFERACEIPWIGCDILNNDDVAVSNGCATNSLCDRNSHVLCRRTAKGPKHQDVRILGVEHVEADPVVMRLALGDTRYAEFLQSARSLATSANCRISDRIRSKSKMLILTNLGINYETLTSVLLLSVG
jgi:hypothetical protein